MKMVARCNHGRGAHWGSTPMGMDMDMESQTARGRTLPRPSLRRTR